MKIAVVGKGGSGKTTVSAVLARTIARQGWATLALDCDTNPNLGISLGLGEEVTERLVALRDAVDTGDVEHPDTSDELVRRFGVDAPDGVRLAVVSAIAHPQPGCPCCGVSPEQLLGQLAAPDLVVVADFEAGLGTVMRLDGRPVDVAVVVVEPTAKSLEVGRRAADLIRETQLGRLVVTANRVRDEQDVARVTAAFPQVSPVLVPDDPAIGEAERRGVAPLDAAPDSPAVRALTSLAEELLASAGEASLPQPRALAD
ncbi:MAG: AAA family ATPase [Nocardioidaceae bacterium]|nr:AAA family ATPase [Nocardioidaceae bacterium]